MNINLGLPWILAIVFMVLKLCGVIDWSWWWVTAPIWGALTIALVLLFVAKVMGLYLDWHHKNKVYKRRGEK